MAGCGYTRVDTAGGGYTRVATAGGGYMRVAVPSHWPAVCTQLQGE